MNILNSIEIFPDIEAMLCDYLYSKLPDWSYPGIQVSTALPDAGDISDNVPFIRVMLIGGSGDNSYIETELWEFSSLIIECWHIDEAKAERLSAIVRGITNQLPNFFDAIEGIEEVTRPFSYPDLESNTARYSMTFTIELRASTLRN